MLTEALRLSGLSPKYNVVVNQEKFFDTLLEFIDLRVTNPGGLPVLHLSMHGSAEGVVLTNGHFIPWNTLGKIITGATEGNALLCMSTCFGFSGCRMAMGTEKRPFLGIIGHSGQVAWDAASVAYVTFYHRLIIGDSIGTAIYAMQQATGDNQFNGLPAVELEKIYTEAMTEQTALAMRRYLENLMRQMPIDSPQPFVTAASAK